MDHWRELFAPLSFLRVLLVAWTFFQLCIMGFLGFFYLGLFMDLHKLGQEPKLTKEQDWFLTALILAGPALTIATFWRVPFLTFLNLFDNLDRFERNSL